MERRVWVNSESVSLFPYDGYRVLQNETILVWKKKWWKFSKWNKVCDKLECEVFVLDSGRIR